MNAGSIRVDDILQMPVSQYDIIRALPFGGGIREVEMKGDLLIRVLNQGRKSAGIGGYLLHNEELVFDEASNAWKLNGSVITPASVYRVALTDFLLTGREANLDFLNTANMVKVYPAETDKMSVKSDIRLAIIKYLENN
jgi:2',3'-cyclic-nucleotide 2'-phosphodiesterase (5'-nucleotidase family)